MTNKKKIGNVIFFLVVFAFTLYTLFWGQDIKSIWISMRHISFWSILTSCLIAIFFVSGEGFIIWFLLRLRKGKSGLLRCIRYSFVGYFFSGITPSATGGQPVQLYQMKKDGNSLADSSVILITVGTAYKFVLVFIGSALLIFWFNPLQMYLGKTYFLLYCFGLSLNIIVVLLLVLVMTFPTIVFKLICGIEFLLIKIKILKISHERKEKINTFICGYREAVDFLKKRPGVIGMVILFTLIQRSSIFFMSYFIYKGFHLQEFSVLTVVLIQAAIYVAVDMLPLPGAQGITELMYITVYSGVFLNFLMPSLYLIRGMSFYFLLLISLVVVVVTQIRYAHRRS